MSRSVVLKCAAGVVLSIFFQSTAEETAECFPPCRTGYLCHEGECISRCNPACPEGQKCTDDGECVSSHTSTQGSTENAKEGKKTVTRDIPCTEVFIVRPDMRLELVPGSYEDDELLSAANMVADAVSSSISAPTSIISVEEIPSVKKCSSRLIVARVKSYHKEPARMGQYEGVVTVVIETYSDLAKDTPDRTEEFTAKGGRHWGDSVPLENAFEAVSKSIRRNYRQ